MPMFLRQLHKVWLGFEGESEIVIYSGISPQGYPMTTGLTKQGGQILGVFANPVREGFDQDMEFIRNGLSYSEWECQDYSIFDSSLQQEEAAQVRGMLLDSETEQEAFQGMIRCIARLEEKYRAAT